MKRIFLIGFMASGKTTHGRRIAEKYGLEFIDLDFYIENRFHKTVKQIFADSGEEGFRLIEKRMLQEVASFENVVIAAGGGTPCFFDNIDIMNAAGDTVYLEATPQLLVNNLKVSNGLAKRPLLANKTDDELLGYIAEMLEKRVPFYEKAKYVMKADDYSDVLFDKLLKN